jgi:polyhydroxybutyrate depolymerase
MNLLSLTLAVLLVAEPLAPGDHARNLKVDGRSRTYLVHVPRKCELPTSIVLAFHGGGSNAEGMVRFCGLNEKADKEKFIVVYPNGTGWLNMLTFNGGNCCGYAMQNKVDDVAFVRALLDDLAKVANVDPKRVYATGMSNGAIMCYLLASELSDRIAAIAPVAGPMGTEACNPKRPVSVMHFHGTDDQFAPFGGGKGKGVSGTNFFSVEHSIRAWVKADGCPEMPVITDEPYRADQRITVQRTTYGPGKDGSEVVLITINGGGHTWPGRDTVGFLGKSTHEISANDLMWEFFKKHPMK